MDLNLTVIAGRLATTPEVREFDSGTKLVRYLVTTRQQRRVDVLPVTLWDPSEEDMKPREPGVRIWATGSVQRRFWADPEGRRSRLEIVAEQVSWKEENDPNN